MSRAYPFGGVFVMRDRAEVEDPAPLEAPAFDIRVEGQPLFTDSGTVATSAGTFHWESALEVTADVWCATQELDLLEARVAHDSEGETIVHRRRIMRVGSGLWLITDDVAPGSVPFELQLQCEASVSPSREGDATLRLSRPLGPDVLVHVAGPIVSSWHISEAWVPATYGEKNPAKAVGCSVGEDGGRSCMLICQESSENLELVSVEAEGGECISVRGHQPAHVLVKAPGVDYVRSSVGRSDADIAWIWEATADQPARYLGVRGTRVELETGEIGTLGGADGWAAGTFGDREDFRTGGLNRPEWKA